MDKEYLIAYYTEFGLNVFSEGELFNEENMKKCKEGLEILIDKEKIKVFKLVKEVK